MLNFAAETLPLFFDASGQDVNLAMRNDNGSLCSRCRDMEPSCLAIADVHRDFKTETHFSNFGLGPHGCLLWIEQLICQTKHVHLLRSGATLPECLYQVLSAAMKYL